MPLYIIIKKESLKHLRKPFLFGLFLILPALVLSLSLYLGEYLQPSYTIGMISNSNRSTSLSLKDDTISIVRANAATYRTDLLLGRYNAVIYPLENGTIEVFALDTRIKSILETYLSSPNANLISHTSPSTTTLPTIPSGPSLGDNHSNIAIHMSSSASNQTMPNLDEFKEVLQANENRLSIFGKGMCYMFLTLFILSTALICSLNKEKAEHIITRTRLTSTSSFTLLFGFFLFYLAVNFLQVLIALPFIILLPFSTDISILAFIITGFITALIATSSALLMVNVTSSDLAASSYASCFVIIISVIGGLFIPYDKLPHGLQVIHGLSPITWLYTFANNPHNLPLPLILFAIVILILCFIFNKYKEIQKGSKSYYPRFQDSTCSKN